MIDISVTGLIKSFDLEKKILDGITFQIDTASAWVFSAKTARARRRSSAS